MPLPLDGIKIIDFSTLLPGPYATMLLADMGAEVIHVESITRPDLLRHLPPLIDERSAAHAMVNRNKKSVTIDLKSKDGQALAKQMIEGADIVIEQFRPGVMAKFGLDYESVKALVPNIIYCSITGYGQTGPLSQAAGHDINYLALSGLSSYSGKKATGPNLVSAQVADVAGGSHHAVMGILAAVIQRNSQGIGQYLDISMSDAAMALNVVYGAAALVDGKSPTYASELLNGGHIYDYYETADGKHLSVGAIEPQFVSIFFEAIGHSSWVERMNNATEMTSLKADIAEIISTKTLAYWTEVFAPLDCCVEPVLSILEASEHPHFVERKMITEVALEDGSYVKQYASAIKFSDEQPEIKVGARLGEHTSEVLAELGLSDSKIEQLKQSKVVF